MSGWTPVSQTGQTVLDQATPEQTLEFIRHVENLTQPCSETQIASSMNKSVKDTVFVASKNLALCFGLVRQTDEGYEISTFGSNLLALTGKLQRDYALGHLGSLEPFVSLTKTLKNEKEMTILEVGRFLSSNFNRNWEEGTQKQIGRIYSHWLDFLQIGSYNKRKGTVEYSLGEIKITEVLVLPSMEDAMSRLIYDRLSENFNTPKNVLSNSTDFYKRVDNPLDTDSEDIGKRFERYVANIFWCFGFQTRTKSGLHKDATKPYADKFGGGDIGLFMHAPIETDEGVKHGYAIVLEAKYSKSRLGSNAVRQVDDFTNRLLKGRNGILRKYLVHKLIVSRSDGYDETGEISSKASGAVHLNHEILERFLIIQVELLKKRKGLMTPFHFIRFINHLLKELSLQPKRDFALDLMKKIIER